MFSPLPMQNSASSIWPRSQVMVILTLSVLLSACGGGTERKKTADGGGGDAPGFDACVATAQPIAQAQLASGDVVDGAQLYDRWYAVLGTPAPAADQPLWATRADAALVKGPEDNWRCKTCHGWDYAGQDGAYKLGSSNYTGFPGILAAQAATTATPENVFCSIKVGTVATGAGHAFGTQLIDDAHVWNLTKFIMEADGVINTTQYISAGNGGIFNANVAEGGELYKGVGCGTPGACHAADGSLNADEGLGGLAIENPWEVLHKVRFGDPDSNSLMGAYQFTEPTLTIPEIANIIAWAQGAPPNGLKGGTGTIVPQGAPGGGSTGGGSSGGGGSTGGGGTVTQNGKFLGASLYDSIVATLGKTLTAGNPLWDVLKASATPTTDVGSWRCKNCHGWDYKGVEGVNAGAFAAAGGPANLLSAQGKDAAQLKATIKSGYVNNTTTGVQVFHAFGQDAAGAGLQNGSAGIVGPGLSDVEIEAIVDFIKNGMIDTSAYIGTRGGAFGDPAQGLAMYTDTAITKSGACVTCHGEQGQTLDFEDGDPATTPNEFVGTIGVENPWEFFHKARWGQPGSTPLMRGTVEAGVPDAQIANLLRYGQTLPIQ